MILMFLSKGYFLSRNCLREIHATVEKHKPYLFAHEVDPSKGGATLESLHEELQRPLRKVLFDGRRITAWHRLGDMQLVSLLQSESERQWGLPSPAHHPTVPCCLRSIQKAVLNAVSTLATRSR